MLIEKLQITAIVIVVIMFLIVCALLFETTMVSDECENCNYLFHNFSTTCTLGFGNIRAQNDEVQLASLSVEYEGDASLQDTTILEKTTGYIASDYLDNITFIGDSRFVALETYGIDLSNIYAKEGLNHRQALTQDFVRLPNGETVTLVDALALNTNEILLINFGVNGAGWFSTNEFVNCYNQLLDLIEENTDNVIIVVQSVLPISKAYESKENGFPNTRIDELNEYILEICVERGIYYLDSSEVLKDETNFLAEEFTGDGLHFNSTGYKLLLQHMKEYTVYK